jgi:quinone-modifying oxidoreductase subunit QmoC
MAGETVLKPDLQFVKRVIASGGDTVKKCYQCDTCSVVCNPTPDAKPFPRKEMHLAQWGLSEVLQDPDIWLCHQCSDCTIYCPRGAKPGEVMSVLRKLCIEKYAAIPKLAQMVGDFKSLPLLIAFPVVVLFLALLVTGHLYLPEGPVVYSKLFPTLLIDAIFVPVAGFAVVVLALGVMRFWQDINSSSPWKARLQGNLVGNLIITIKDILLHDRFKKCETTYKRSTNHLLMLFGFIFLAVVTGLAFFNEWIRHYDSPYPIYEPLKLLAIVGTAGLLYGIYNILRERQANAEKAGYGTYYDWLLIYVVFAVGATGLLSWLLRLLGIGILAYPVYFIHLTSVFFLFFYAPYTKMAHFVYRTAAMLHARMSDRGF